jgi:hypothetical protein
VRRRGHAYEVTLPCNVGLRRYRQGVLPLGDEASHAKHLGVTHGLLEEGTALLYVASTAPLQMGYPQFGARLARFSGSHSRRPCSIRSSMPV